MSALETPRQRRMVAVVAPDDAIRAYLASDLPVPFGIVFAETPEEACQAAPSERLRAEIAAGNLTRTQITACMLPKGHAAHARYGTAVHMGVVDDVPTLSPFALYQWVVL